MGDRGVLRRFRGIETKDGAGVRLRRIFGHNEVADMDPFLLLDAFGSDRPADYLPGFPWHPHRGIETVTYLMRGSVRHGDSLGNSGLIGPGDLQWMSSGSGIIHEEMPQRSEGGVFGFQLWVNLAAAEKMREPAYRGVLAAEVPLVEAEGAVVRVLAGAYGDARGPVRGLSRDPEYFDISLEPQAEIALPAPSDRTAFAFVFEGGIGAAQAQAGDCVLFGDGETARIAAGPEGARLIYASAPPLRESVAWGGPIVMNTSEELEEAFREIEEGSFVKRR
jgi:Pirin-related protein